MTLRNIYNCDIAFHCWLGKYFQSIKMTKAFDCIKNSRKKCNRQIKKHDNLKNSPNQKTPVFID